MNSRFSMVFCLPSLVLAAAIAGCATTEEKSAEPVKPEAKVEAAAKKPAAPAKPKTFQQQLSEFNRSMNAKWNGKLTNGKSIEALLKFRDEVAGTNRADRLATELSILDLCVMPPWTAVKRWDLTLQDKYIPEFSKPVVDDATLPLQTRLDFATYYCRWLAGEKRFKEADAVAAKMIDAALKTPKTPAHLTCRAYKLKADCRRWDFDYDGALAAAKEAMKHNLGDGRVKACDIAFEFGHPEEAEKLWAAANDPYGKVCYFNDRKQGARVRKEALAYVTCPTNQPARRSEVLNRFFLVDKSPEGAAARASLAKDYVPGGAWWMNNMLKSLYVKGDWAFFAEIYAFARMKTMDNPAGHRAYVFALGASGQKDLALMKAGEYLKDEKLDKKERAKLGALVAVISGADALVPLAAIKDEPKAYAEAVRDTATWCLNMEKNAECRRYAEAYQALVRPQPKRVVGVKWLDEAVTSISDWRRIEAGLEKTYVDIKMQGDLDNLVTDVATGRVAVEKTEKDTDDAKFEVSTLCDVNGLSIFLRVRDANARLVEKGLAGGLGTEMYFAPGDNQPYICFGSTPRAGVEFCFQTAYETADHKRLNVTGPRDRYSLVSEVAFSDDDYVLRLFFPWDAFYQKLPTAGTEWKFECLSFGPKGGVSWGGAQGVHESSSWGRLRFALTEAQLRAIKRRLIYATYKSWNVPSHGEVAPFDKWADPVIGDPEFYKTALKPLEAELVGYQKRVTADMSDADVDEIAEKALGRWIGIRHVIDVLRREYLLTH